MFIIDAEKKLKKVNVTVNLAIVYFVYNINLACTYNVKQNLIADQYLLKYPRHCKYRIPNINAQYDRNFLKNTISYFDCFKKPFHTKFVKIYIISFMHLVEVISLLLRNIILFYFTLLSLTLNFIPATCRSDLHKYREKCCSCKARTFIFYFHV